MPRERRTAICSSPRQAGWRWRSTPWARFRSMIDVTIAYPDGAPSFWDLACGRAGAVRVRMRQLPVPQAFCEADYSRDKAFRAEFHHWLGQQWQAKDEEIEALTARTPPRLDPDGPRRLRARRQHRARALAEADARIAPSRIRARMRIWSPSCRKVRFSPTAARSASCRPGSAPAASRPRRAAGRTACRCPACRPVAGCSR